MALYGFVHLSINLRSARQRVTTNSRRLLMTSEVIENRRAHNAGRFLVETKRKKEKSFEHSRVRTLLKCEHAMLRARTMDSSAAGVGQVMFQGSEASVSGTRWRR